MSDEQTNYWAFFKKIGTDTFRFDTRIYIEPISEIQKEDTCVGAVVGKNPGSAKQSNIADGMQPIKLDSDKLLPTVKSILKKSYTMANIELPKRGYVQILNLFYLCNPKLDEALIKIKANKNAENCQTEKQLSPWVWYVWGKKSDSLSQYKERFLELNSSNHFYFDNVLSKVVEKPASNDVFARHTQGLKHNLIVAHISNLIKNQKK